ncbi:hypothetical protein [uncultured Xanthomonas sp.]|nr:hypothetical protein [uncultured Xanthomonas sp.]
MSSIDWFRTILLAEVIVFSILGLFSGIRATRRGASLFRPLR